MFPQSEKEALGYALSDQDIMRLNPRTKLLLYEDVKRYPSIDHLLHPFDSVIILYEWERTRDASIGHYITVNRVNDGIVEHFDSYGIKPDKELDQLKDSSPAFRKMTGQDQKYLLNLYAKARSPIAYNQYKLQSLDDGVATCGRYAVLRSRYKHMPLDEFARIFTGKRETPDQIAVKMTEPLFYRQ